MLTFDKYGSIDLISGFLLLFTESGMIPKAITLLLGGFLLVRGLSAVVDRFELPELTFMIYGGADFLAAIALVIGTVSLPIVAGYSSQYAGILMIKGGWIFIHKIND